MSTADIILGLMARYDRSGIGTMSTGEALAVAMVLDDYNMLAAIGGGYTMLEACERLGPEWFKAALQVQRDGEFHRRPRT
jgi:hypothetical protein